jgi:hypothetical protein
MTTEQRSTLTLLKAQGDKMNIDDLDTIKKSGFEGFKKISELKVNSTLIPKVKGVYLLLRPDSRKVEFIEIGTGGFFKDKNPNVATSELINRWVEDAQIIYIGKAGGANRDATLNSRLKQYLNFGQEKKVGHWGGRYIWQIKNIDDYIICWKELPDDEPRDIEIDLLEMFKERFFRLPYANISN